jgi:hypothetical protein
MDVQGQYMQKNANCEKYIAKKGALCYNSDDMTDFYLMRKDSL